ncbi:MAG: hypothetical protein EA397_14805 [Deltaproteobacteria bacterium]|nr:MAG: hypothetical protein EA397_14805 [Deltaproteobacteria bacterium]
MLPSMRTTITLLLPALLGLAACLDAQTVAGDPAVELETHAFPLPPDFDGKETHIGSGYVTGEALEQPIPFSHYKHAQMLGIDCQYCHSEARKSKHSGIPPLQTCMGCHQWVKTDSKDIQKVASYWKEEKPIPWKKVHDIADFVHFAHKPHIRGGVDCTECHGQVQLQGMPERIHVGVNHDDGEPIQADRVVNVMIRETTMQMGWCIDCHANHPSIDKNYGDQANLRRAELKDCWTCHK